MARLPELCAALAKVDGRDAAAIGRIARVVREAGLITTTKRGVGAADMTAADAANLIIALNACHAAKDAVSTVRRFRAAERMWVDSPITPGIGPYGSIAAASTFGDALEATIESVPAIIREFAETIYKTPNIQSEIWLKALLKGEGLPWEDVIVEFNKMDASIERYSPGETDSEEIWFHYAVSYFHPDLPDPDDELNRNITVWISLPTLIRVWRTLHGEAAYKKVCDGAAAAAAANQLPAVGTN